MQLVLIHSLSHKTSVKNMINTLQQNKEPKAVIRLSELNVAFIPDKTPHQNSLQLSWLRDGTTRHVFVHHDDPQTIVTWYMAIRCAKLHLLQVAYPSAQDDEVCHLT